MHQSIAELYAERIGEPPERIVDLRPDGSSRRIWRLFGSDGSTIIGVFGPDREENHAFVSFSRSFRSLALPVPEILAFDEQRRIYLEEDLGDTTLYDLLQRDRGAAMPIYRRAVATLPRFQIEGGRIIDYSAAYPCEEFDRGSMKWDLNYFKYHFLKLAHVSFNERRLEQDFDTLCDALLRYDRSHFMYRDFQSRNIMVRRGEPWFIDYQGGRRGALAYDLASLLYDAKADLSPAFRMELTDLYLEALSEYPGIELSAVREGMPLFVLIRILQAMGAYGYRGFFERKSHFLASVPFAVENLRGLLEVGLPVRLPELTAALQAICDRTWGPDRPVGDVERRVNVTIQSFSYRRGYPRSTTVHGGGFVFDCRQLDNPGRIAEYAYLSGLDAPVIAYLEGDPGVTRFFEEAAALVEGAVTSFRARGFTDIQVAFGCTGGRHRSVYMAERLARFLSDRFDSVNTVVDHTEREQWPLRAPSDAPLSEAS